MVGSRLHQCCRISQMNQAASLMSEIAGECVLAVVGVFTNNFPDGADATPNRRRSSSEYPQRVPADFADFFRRDP